MTTRPLNSQSGPRHLNVLWHDQSWTMAAVRSASGLSRTKPGQTSPCRTGFKIHYSKFTIQNYSRRAFTVLEMLVVVTIIGILAAASLPHLPGMTKANSMTTAVQQMLGDCALARQLAISHRSTVYMVFVPPYSFATNGTLVNEGFSYTNLLAHQYGAYALVSLRSVGDQPGQANPQYLTEWKPLPDGIFVAPWKFTNTTSLTITSTNTLVGTVNVFHIFPFPANLNFPFPAVDALGSLGTYYLNLPYIGFSPLGQLTTSGDEFIPLTRGRVFYIGGATTATALENPTGGSISNPDLIHIDWLTARAKIERNQLR